MSKNREENRRTKKILYNVQFQHSQITQKNFE